MGVDFVHFNGMTGEFYYSEHMGGGAALFDMDQDGDLDLYLTQGRLIGPGKTLGDAVFPPTEGAFLGDRLYRNDLVEGPEGQRTLRFTEVTTESGLGLEDNSMGVAVGDVDGNGFPDLFVTTWDSPNRLYLNRGPDASGVVTFEDVTETAGVGNRRWAIAAAFVDYDRDGRLDLYVGNYLDYELATHKECTNNLGLLDYCGPASYRAVRDVLYRNLGPGDDGVVRFSDVTAEAGVVESPAAALGVVSGDFDGDGWSDLYIANDEFPNHLLMNQRNGRFRDEALLSGSAMNAEGKAEAGMGVDAADGDGDGDLDLFVAHLTEETNTLYVNQGGLFEDRTTQSDLALPSFEFTGFGAVFLDYDNDRRPDLMVANGAIRGTPEGLARQEPFPLAQRNQLFHNLGNGRFAEASSSAGPAFEREAVSRGLAKGDLDNDGDTDVVVVNNAGPVEVLLNEVGQDRPWVGLRLVTGDGRDALGAEVVLPGVDDGATLHRVKTDGSYASAHDPRLLLALPGEDPVAEILVRWPDGRQERFSNLDARRYNTIRQGTGQAAEATP